jgi:[ribosomal protein S18]-alanine N-acetyltransferase
MMSQMGSSAACGPRLRPLTPEDATAVAAWRYEGPWSVYDARQEDEISTAKGYQAIVDERGRFIGYVCTGQEARVPGLTGEEGVMDVGVGLDPGVVGQGRGASILGPILLSIAAESDARSMRAVVQSWNERSLRLCVRLAFCEAGRHVVKEPGGDVEYVIMMRAPGTSERGEWPR